MAGKIRNWLNKVRKNAFFPLNPMSKIALISVAALCLSAVFVLLLIWRSAEGHEDEKGFHPGSADNSPEAQANDDAKVEPKKITSPESIAPIAATKR
jgi:hypothetical protein